VDHNGRILICAFQKQISPIAAVRVMSVKVLLLPFANCGLLIALSVTLLAMSNPLQILLLACTALLLMPVNGRAQAQGQQTPPATASPQANAGDVDTIEHIISAVYDAISGPIGPRNWGRFRSLFYTDARLMPSRRDDAGKVSVFNFTLDQYIERATGVFNIEGFFEAQVSNRIEVWDHIAHVWSTYESRHAKGEKPFARGINSFQLFNDGTRWWVLTIYWEVESAGHPLPEKYLSR